MKMVRNGMVAAVLTTVLAIAGVSWAAGFSPESSFKLSSRKQKTPISLNVKVAQDRGEEELFEVALKVPSGFGIPNLNAFEGCTPRPHAAVPCDGEVLGEGLIHIMVGPGCAASPPNAEAANNTELPAKLVVVEETADDRQGGILGIWNLEITGVTTIPLYVGKSSGNWVISGSIAPNQFTCPEFDFELDIFDRSEESTTGLGGGRTIFVTPTVTENKEFTLSAKFTSEFGSTVTNTQKVTITK